MNKILYSIAFVVGFSVVSFAQTGEIQGKVTDDKGAPSSFSQVVIVEDEAGLKTTSKGARTDANGRYTIKGLSPGLYNVMAKALGKPKQVEVGVQVYVGRPTTLNIQLGAAENVLGQGKIVVKAQRLNKAKLLDVFTPKENTVTAAEVKENSVRDVNSLAGSTGQIVQSDFGAALNVAGGRDDGNVYFVDGVKVTGSSSIPPSSIGQLEVITSGVPAKYGDATGGVISITTKGPSNKLSGGIEGLTSQYLDPYSFKLLGGNLSGPLIRRKPDIDSSNKALLGLGLKGEVALGFFLSAEFQQDGDRFPTINGKYKIKDSKFKQLQETPYIMSADGASIISSQELLTNNDIEAISAHQNTSSQTMRLNGKLDWKVNKNGTNVTFGGRFTDEQYSDLIQRYSLANYDNNPKYEDRTYGGYLRLYQPLFNADKQVEKSIRNTTMQLQLDYEKTGQNYYSPVGQYNPWNYGYVGKFTELAGENTTQSSADGSAFTNVFYGSGDNDYIQFNTHYRRTTVSKGLNFDGTGSVNPLAASFTKSFLEVYQENIGTPTTVNEIDNAGALVNGKRASVFIHGLFYPMARIFNGFQYQEKEQFRASGNFNFDIVKKKSEDLNKHTIEAGFELEQRYESQYNISPNALWYVASTSLNTHLSHIYDKNYNPLLIMKDGTERMRLQDYIKQLGEPNPTYFSAIDTVFYDTEVSNGQQTNFSKNFRQALGIDSLTRVNIHEYDPNQLNLNFFSADELLASSVFVNYYGYNYLGEKSANNIAFNDFFTARDEKGNFKREVAPRSPMYAAAYIQDRFQLKEIAFNLGFRADYFNPNTYSLIDPYVPQRARNISEVTKIGSDEIIHPDNLSKDAIVYVDNATAPTRVTGYRVGRQWYNTVGDELYGPNSIITASGGQINPYLKGDNAVERSKYSMASSTFDPNLMFEQTPAIINFMPRLNFSFKIDSNSLIFAHFDRMAQRPSQDRNQVSSLDYYNLLVRSSTAFMRNPNLLSPKTTDLEIGFKQRLDNRSSVTLNFYYREYIDQIQISKYDGAYPSSYLTYANADFSTVKGFGLAYELRRTNNLRLKANYTMQFASGTGSSDQSQLNLINAGVGNIKVIAPLSFDVRHNINLNLDYRFADGVNYMGPMKLKKVLQNSGINVQSFLRSGTPYTLQSNAVGSAYITSTDRAITVGDINSGTLPWGYNVNLKIDKDFTFKWGKKPTDSLAIDERKKLSFNVYLQVRNVLNTFRTLDVYRYTGTAEEDGYLASPNGQLDYSSKESTLTGYGQSFRDLYKLALEIPSERDGQNSFYAQPRIIQLGAILSF